MKPLCVIVLTCAVLAGCTASSSSTSTSISPTVATSTPTLLGRDAAAPDGSSSCRDADPLVVLRRLVAAAADPSIRFDSCFLPGFGATGDVAAWLGSAPALIDDTTGVVPSEPRQALGTDPVTYQVPNPDTPRLQDGSVVSPPHQSGGQITLARLPDGLYGVEAFIRYVSS